MRLDEPCLLIGFPFLFQSIIQEGIDMSLFTKEKKLKFKEIPSTSEQTQARSYLQGLEQRDLQFPTLQVAELTPEEQAIQNALPDYFAGSQDSYNQSKKYYSDVLSGSYDPLTSPYYQGLRANLEARTKADVQRVKRAGQGSGMLRSGPTQALAAEQERLGNADIATVEGQLLESERNRMQNAAGSMLGLEQSRLSTMAGVSSLAEKARAIQQAKNQAAFESAIQDMLAPYLYNAQIASALLNERRYVSYETGGGMNDLGQALTMGSEKAGSLLTMGSKMAGSFMNPAGGAQAMSGGGGGGFGGTYAPGGGQSYSIPMGWSGDESTGAIY
jgi:hypothetical protein